MIKPNWLNMNKWKKVLCLFWLSSTLLSMGCGGGGGGTAGSGGAGDDPDPPIQATWSGTQVLQLAPGGLLTPRLQALPLGQENIGILFFEDSQTGEGYDLKRLLFQIDEAQTLAAVEEDRVITLDNCKSLSGALSEDGSLTIAYQGGEIKDCGGEDQADAMFSMEDGGSWEEYTGAIGEVERNPVFHDGLAGGDMSVALDSSGNIHLCYQFFYEGCDTMNAQYPDLNYVRKSFSDPGALVSEEQVEGNVYYTGGGVQNNVGHHCRMILDQDENPVIFYYAELPGNIKGLRMARKAGATWVKSWIETGVKVEGLSCGMASDGHFGVAYYVVNYKDPLTSEESPACLRYARNTEAQPSTWTCAMVDDNTLCGNYPSLSFNASGQPAIAYYEEETYSGYSLQNLKIAVFNGQSWGVETAASSGNIGWYNTLWFGEDGTPFICTYSESEKRIYLFHKS